MSNPAGLDESSAPHDHSGVVTDRSRLIAALAYVPTLCFLPYFVATDDDFARFHGRQAFLILFSAAVFGVAEQLAEWALGPLPVLGVVAQVIGRLAFALGLVLLSGLGALRALTGERRSLDWIARTAERLPM